jgi:hypothetical protein
MMLVSPVGLAEASDAGDSGSGVGIAESGESVDVVAASVAVM